MTCMLFAKMDQVFSKKTKYLKKYWKMGKNTGKVREKSGNFVSPEKWEPCLPTLDKVKSLNDGQFHVIMLDDLMEYIIKSVETQNLFTKYCHHYNITAIFLTQNIFAQGPHARTININTHVLVLFANKRDESQALNLGKQLYPCNSKFLWKLMKMQHLFYMDI